MVDSAAATKKIPKQKGPVRLEAIVPLLIVVGLIMLYFMLFFDAHLRRGIEYAASKANGAEVNIGKLNTSLWNASVVISNIEVTNPEMPSTNRVQIGTVKFLMVWDALLRGKVKIDEASINGVQIDTPRKHPGRVLPVKASGEGEGVGDKVLTQMKTEFSGNVVGDLASVAAGGDSKAQVTAVATDMKSSAYLDDMQKSLEVKNKIWQARMAVLPKTQDFAALHGRLKQVQMDNFKDVPQIQASLKELEAIRNDFDTKSKSVSDTAAALNTETATARASYADLDKIIKQDVADLQARMHLPTLDGKSLSRALFGMDVLGKLQQARHYMEQARSYIPPKSEKKKTVVVNPREKGHDYVFGQPNSYPPFWLRRALISSSNEKGQSDLAGEILDLTTNQAMVGRPMIATIKGNFPQQGIRGINASLIIDHLSSVPTERLLLGVDQYAVAGRSLVSSPAVELGISKADSALKFSAELQGDNVDVRLGNQFTNVAFVSKAESDVVREMMTASLAGLNKVNLNAHVTGTWSKLDWQVSSNLADALVQGMQRYLQDKMADARARIESLVNDKIKEQRQRLYAQQSTIETDLKAGINERQAQIDKLRSELDAARNTLDARMKELVGAQQQKLKQGGDKLLDDLRKKF